MEENKKLLTAKEFEEIRYTKQDKLIEFLENNKDNAYHFDYLMELFTIKKSQLYQYLKNLQLLNRVVSKGKYYKFNVEGIKL